MMRSQVPAEQLPLVVFCQQQVEEAPVVRTAHRQPVLAHVMVVRAVLSASIQPIMAAAAVAVLEVGLSKALLSIVPLMAKMVKRVHQLLEIYQMGITEARPETAALMAMMAAQEAWTVKAIPSAARAQ